MPAATAGASGDATGRWRDRDSNGKPVDAAQHETCLSCHEGNVKDHDFVFTRYAQ